jgi:GNAT superfamily N-acetyltransferase
MGERWYECDLSRFSDREIISMQGNVPFQFFRLADVIDEPDTPPRLFDLVREGVLQTPGHSGGFETFEVFLNRIYGVSYAAHAETQYLAADDCHWIALSSIHIKGNDGICGLTTVRPSYRGKGVASALKTWAMMDGLNRAHPLAYPCR